MVSTIRNLFVWFMPKEKMETKSFFTYINSASASSTEDENYEEFYPSVHMSAMEKSKSRLKQILIANLWALATSFAFVFVLFFIDSFLKADFDVSIGWLGGITYAFTYFYQLLKQRNINL